MTFHSDNGLSAYNTCNLDSFYSRSRRLLGDAFALNTIGYGNSTADIAKATFYITLCNALVLLSVAIIPHTPFALRRNGLPVLCTGARLRTRIASFQSFFCWLSNSLLTENHLPVYVIWFFELLKTSLKKPFPAI